MVRVLRIAVLSVAYLLCGGSVVAFLSGSSCVITSCYGYDDDDDDLNLDDDDDHHHNSCHDDDDDDDDIQVPPPSPGSGPPMRLPARGSATTANWQSVAGDRGSRGAGRLRPRAYTIVPSEGERAHPVALLTDIRGIALFAPGLGDEYAALELRSFTEDFLEANQDLLGLPETAGALVFDEVRFQGQWIAVDYVQVLPDGTEVGEELAEAGLTFLFDTLGNLLEIENRTVVALEDGEGT